MAALVASLTKRPARIVYTKDDDMKYTGKRHPFKAFYKIAFTDRGVLQGVDVQLYFQRWMHAGSFGGRF